jgi:hypothetical protein
MCKKQTHALLSRTFMHASVYGTHACMHAWRARAHTHTHTQQSQQAHMHIPKPCTCALAYMPTCMPANTYAQDRTQKANLHMHVYTDHHMHTRIQQHTLTDIHMRARADTHTCKYAKGQGVNLEPTFKKKASNILFHRRQ